MDSHTKFRAKFDLWRGQEFSKHDVHTSGKDAQAALRRAIRGVLRTKQPLAGKETVRNQLRGALATIGRHYDVAPVEGAQESLTRQRLYDISRHRG